MVIRTASGSTARRMSLIVAMRVDAGALAAGSGAAVAARAGVAVAGRVAGGGVCETTTSSSTRISPEFILVNCSGTCLASLLVGYIAASFLNSLAAASLSAGWPNRANASSDSRAACHSALSA